MAAKKNSVFFLPATPFEIVDIVTKLELKTIYGVDDIPINILKATICTIVSFRIQLGFL